MSKKSYKYYVTYHDITGGFITKSWKACEGKRLVIREEYRQGAIKQKKFKTKEDAEEYIKELEIERDAERGFSDEEVNKLVNRWFEKIELDIKDGILQPLIKNQEEQEEIKEIPNINKSKYIKLQDELSKTSKLLFHK